MTNFIGFLNKKGITEEQFEGFGFDKKAELGNEYNAEMKSYISNLEKKLSEKAGSEDIEELKAQFESAKSKRDEAIDSQMKSINAS